MTQRILLISPAVLVSLALAAVALAQTPLQFEVATIKPTNPDMRGIRIMIQPGGGLKVEGATLKQLITNAYSIRDFQVTGGPSWIATDRFDINAKTDQSDAAPLPQKMNDEQRTEMQRQFKERLRSLLADRFHLVVRQETKDMPIYALVVAKSGSKLKLSDPGAAGNQGLRMQPGMLTGSSAPLDLLLMGLSNVVARPVIDKTGLAGKFDWKLEWTPDQPQAKTPGLGEAPVPTDISGPSIFTAIEEQLGLKLESQKGPAPLVIVDKAEKPSAN